MSKQVFTQFLNAASGAAENFSLFAGLWNATEVEATALCATAGTFRNMRIVAPDPGPGNSITYVLRINGADTALTITFNSGETDKSDTTNIISVAAGDRITLHSIPVSGPVTLGGIQVCLDFDGATSKRYTYGGSTGISPISATRRAGAVSYFASATEALVTSVFPMAGTITRLFVRGSVNPTPGTWVCAIVKNHVLQDGGGGTVDTRVTIAIGAVQTYSSSFSLSVAAGDLISVEFAASASPAVSVISHGIEFVGDEERFILFSNTTDGIINSATIQFQRIHGAQNSMIWDATETDVDTQNLSTIYTIKNLYVVLDVAAAVTTDYAVRLNAASVLTVSLGTADVAGNATGDVNIALNDLLALSYDASALPGAHIPRSAVSATALGVESTFDWRPQTSADLARPPRVVEGMHVGPFVTALAPPAPDLPLAYFPASLPHPTLRQQPYAVGLGVPLPNPAEAVLQWKPTFPATVPRAPGRPDLMPSLFLDVRPTPPAPLETWAPIFPDQILPPARVLPESYVSGAVDFPIVVSLFSWQPTFPDRLPRTDYATHLQQAFVLGLQATNPPPALSWRPVYPDAFPPLGRVDASVLVQPIDPIANAASPDLAWKPIFPDAIAHIAFPTSLQQTIARPSVVIPNVTDESWLPIYPTQILRAPSKHASLIPASLQRFEPPFVIPDLQMRWKPTFPDRLIHPAPRLVGELVMPASFERAVSPESFLPQYPVQIDRRTFHASLQSSFHAPPPGGFLVVAQSLAWLPVYPVQFPPVVRVVPAPGGWLVEPLIPAGGEFCVEISDVDVTRPTIAGEVLTLSDIVDEAVTTPTILEELC